VLSGGCRCGAVRYRVSGAAAHSSICHCNDCRRSSGAPFVAWFAVTSDCFKLVAGEPGRWSSDGDALRHFCGRCGTPLHYVNQRVAPGQVDLPTCTLDDPEAMPPQIQVQTTERLGWVASISDLPALERYPL
jgi:hypothetical protein